MSKYMRLLYDQLTEGDGGGGGKPIETPTPPAAPIAENKAAPQSTGDNLDEFGYEKPPQANQPGEKIPPAGKEAPPKEVEKPEEKEIKPGTGYGAKPVAPPVEVPPAEVPPAPPKNELPFELDLKEVPEAEAKKLQDYAKAHSLTKEAAQALVDLRKSELKEISANMVKLKDDLKKDQDKTKAKWDQELRTKWADKFPQNLQKVEKILDQYFPDTKKRLTESGGMLPAHVMQEMCALAEHVFSTERLTTGEPAGSGAPPVEMKRSSPLDFYE